MKERKTQATFLPTVETSQALSSCKVRIFFELFTVDNMLIKRSLSVIILLSLLLAVLPAPSSAHPPSDVHLEYDFLNQKLNVTISHNVGNPSTHYIQRVRVTKNSVTVIDEQYTSQPTGNTFTYTYDVSADDGDLLEAYAECNLGGSLTGQTTVAGPDHTPPEIDITHPLENDQFDTDGISVVGTASDNRGIAGVDVKLNDGAWIPADGTTGWSIDLVLAEGLNSIYSRATDTSGNEAFDTVNVTYTEPVDIIPPVIEMITPVEGQVFFIENVTVSGSADDDMALDKIEIRVNEDPWQQANGTVSWSIEATLAQGANAIHARAWDTSGNNATSMVNVTYNTTGSADNTPPSVMISFPSGGQIFESGSVKVQGNASDDVGLAKVEATLNGGPWQICIGLGSWSIDLALMKGTNKIMVRATDSSGNNATDQVNVTREEADVIPPSINIIEPGEGRVFNSSLATVSGSSDDDGGVINVEIRVNDGMWIKAEGTSYWSADVMLERGNNTIFVRVTDSSGNNATSSVNVTYSVPDTTPPVLSIASPRDREELYTSFITVTGTAYDEESLEMVEVRLNEGEWTEAEGLANWSLDLDLAEGTNVISARARDMSGNNFTARIELVYERKDPQVSKVDMDGLVEDGEYEFDASFDGGNFVIFWRIEADHIYMAIRAKTTGWVSIGFDPSVRMKDADMLIGWVTKSGTAGLLDCYSTGDYGPHPPDTSLGGTDDIIRYEGSESGGSTTIEFKRLLRTGDRYDTNMELDGPMEIIWAVGDDDDYTSGHGVARGAGTIDLLTGESTERDIPVLWPYHAGLMILGIALMLFGTFTARFLRKKRWWFKVHRAVGIIAALAVASGLIMSVVMVSVSHGSHFSIPHTYMGALTLLFVLSTPLIGYLQSKIRGKRKLLASMHRWFGRIALVLIVITIIGGLSLAGVL